MAKAAIWALLALAATVALSGCGTATNLGLHDMGHVQCDHLSPDARVYGGVLEDLEMLLAATDHRWSRLGPWLEAVAVASLLIDMPFSAVGDTVTLPLTAYAVWQKRTVAEGSRD